MTKPAAFAIALLFFAMEAQGSGSRSRYTPPTPENVPAPWDSGAGVTSAADAALDEWWSVFEDPLLEAYVERAVVNNFDVQVALGRVLEARAGVQGESNGLLPQIGFGGTFTRARPSFTSPTVGSSAARQGLTASTIEYGQAGFDATWELDLFGGVRQAVKKADFELQAAEFHRRDVLLRVVAEVARNYMELRGAQRLIAVTDQRIRTQEELLELVKTRRDIGLASDLEMSQASGQLETTRAALPDLQAAVRIAAHRLAVLVGAKPGELLEELSRPQALPRAAGLVPAGLPSELLERRPDIRRAERLLGAAHFGVRAARSERWPKFFLTGAGGVESGSVSRILNAASRAWIWSPGFTLPIFQMRGIRAQIRAAEARNDQALATYYQTVLLALEDVENAFVRYGQAQRKEEMLGAAVADNEKAVELSQTLYQEGLSDFLTVLDAERRLFEAQAQWVASETAVLTSLTGLYKSLGGGW